MNAPGQLPPETSGAKSGEPRPRRTSDFPRWADPLVALGRRIHGVLWDIPGAGRAIRSVLILMRGFRGEAISLRASALTYLTLFALVPLLAVVYSVLDLVGDEASVRISVSQWLTQQLGIGAGAALETKLQELTTNASVKTLGAIGFAFLLFSVISLLSNIESAFNHIYAVKRPRKLLDRLLKYWAFLTLGPFLLAGSLALTWKISALRKIHAAHDQVGHSELLHVITALSSVAITYMALTLLYKVLPNARVPLRSAFTSAFVAGTAWELAKFIFSFASQRMVQVHMIYGSLAVLPIMLTWVYISWLITLSGCRLCFALEASRRPPAHPLLRGAASREALTARVGIELARQHRDRKQPVKVRWIAGELGLTRRLVLECLRALQAGAVVAETRARRWLPARDVSTITLAELRAAGRHTLPFPPLERDHLAQPLAHAWKVAESAAAGELHETIGSFLERYDRPLAEIGAQAPAPRSTDEGRPPPALHAPIKPSRA